MAVSSLFALPSLPWLQDFRQSRRLTLITICFAMFTDGFIYGVITPVIPYLLEDEGIATTENATKYNYWLIAAFSIADFFAGPLCAIYVDYGGSRKIAWFIGVGLLTAGTIFFAFPSTYATLVCCQILHGASSAILYTVGLAILVDTVDAQEVGRHMGTMMTFSNVGIVISPMIGGALYNKPHIYSILAIMLIFGLGNFLLRILLKAPPTPVLVSASAMNSRPVSVEDVEDKEHSETSSSIHLYNSTPSPNRRRCWPHLALPSSESQSGFLTRLSGFVPLLSSPRLAAALYGIFVGEFVIAAALTSIFIYAKQTFNWTASIAGLLSLCVGVPAIFGWIAGWATDRYGARWIAVAGFVGATPALFVLRLVDHESSAQVALLCVLLSIMALALMSVLTALSAEFAYVAGEMAGEETGAATPLLASSFSLLNCGVALAGGVGPMAAGALMDGKGWKDMTILMGVVCFTAVVPCISYTAGRARLSPSHSQSIIEDNSNENQT